jgi:hypothetical protein
MGEPQLDQQCMRVSYWECPQGQKCRAGCARHPSLFSKANHMNIRTLYDATPQGCHSERSEESFDFAKLRSGQV